MKILVVYDSKFGNNKQIAGRLAGHLERAGNAVMVHHAKEISPKEVARGAFDALLFGGPPRAGMISFTIKNWTSGAAKALTKAGITLQKVAAWGTHGEATPGENIPEKWTWAGLSATWLALLEKVPAAKMLPGVAGFSVGGMEGPLEEGWEAKVEALARAFTDM